MAEPEVSTSAQLHAAEPDSVLSPQFQALQDQFAEGQVKLAAGQDRILDVLRTLQLMITKQASVADGSISRLSARMNNMEVLRRSASAEATVAGGPTSFKSGRLSRSASQGSLGHSLRPSQASLGGARPSSTNMPVPMEVDPIGAPTPRREHKSILSSRRPSHTPAFNVDYASEDERPESPHRTAAAGTWTFQTPRAKERVVHLLPPGEEVDVQLQEGETFSPKSVQSVDADSDESFGTHRRPSTAISIASDISLNLAFHTGWSSSRPKIQKRSTMKRSRTQILQMISFHEPLVEKTERECITAVNPNSPFRTFVDICAMLMLAHDAIMVPFLLAWNIPEENYLWGLWITRIFWTMEMPLSCVTGYHTLDQKLELRLTYAIRHYSRTWFVPDLSLVLVDWLGFVMKDFRVLRMSRLRNSFRFMRLVRAVSKLPRASDLWSRMVMHSQRKEVHLFIGILRLVCGILWVNHVVGCGWYFLGKNTDGDTGETWLNNDADGYKFQFSMFYEYTTALHWSITQMTPGSMEVVPKSSAERVYTVVALFIGMVLGSTLVATLSSMMTNYRLQLEARSKKSLQLQHFLSEQEVEPMLALTIRRYIAISAHKKVSLRMRDVDYLKDIPKAMHQELTQFLYMKIFSSHSFFGSLDEYDKEAMNALCNNSFSALDYPIGEYVFEEEDSGEAMYFVSEGFFQYLPGARAMEPNATTLKRGHWCSEAVVWTNGWIHLGTLVAQSAGEAQMLTTTAALLQRELKQFPAAFGTAAAFGYAYHRHLQDRGVQRSDLSFSIDYAEVMFTMAQNAREALARPLLAQARKKKTNLVTNLKLPLPSPFRKESKLDVEFGEGMCNVSIANGEVVRSVFTVALRLRRAADQRFLVQVGTLSTEKNEVQYACMLPRIRRCQDETSAAAMQRFLATELADLAHGVDVALDKGAERSRRISEHPKSGLRTQYLQATFSGRTTGPLPFHQQLEVTASAKRAAELYNAEGIYTRFCLSRHRRDMRQCVVQVLTGIEELHVLTPSLPVRPSGVSESSMAKPSLVRRMSMRNRSRDSREPSLLPGDAQFFIWLSDADFQILSDPEAELILRDWLYAAVTSHTTQSLNTRKSSLQSHW